MEIRPLTRKDLPQVIKIHQYAYGFWSDQEVEESEYNHIIPENSLGAFVDGQLESALTILKVQQSVRGVLKSLGGISMVASFPEVRTQGFVRALMERAFTDMHEGNIVVSMLEPFRDSFYARFGYVQANDFFRLTAPIHNLRIPSKENIGDDWSFERKTGLEAKTPYLNFIQKYPPNKYHGYAFNPNIKDAEWTRRNKNRQFVFIKQNGETKALVRYQVKGYMHFEEGQLLIDEMYWNSIEAQAALFYFLGTHRDQVQKLQLRLPYGTHFQHWFIDLKDWIEIKVWNPWMVRLINAEEAFNGLPAPIKGDLIFALNDPRCSWNSRLYHLQSDNGQLQVDATSKAPAVTLTIEGAS
ncbi:MAG: GNAT family N-acetyltransferase, partial [Candidatus Hermodarchaeota archaeon]|nr:GNAT family N-acetyltransferase [Candidatus Hermodarchaeota archaeon]